MSVYQYYKENKNQLGIKVALKKTLQYGLRKIAGMDQYEVRLFKQQEELNTLHYFLNNNVDITKVKPAGGALRSLQLCDATFLAIVDKILQKNNLKYWIGWGTLLGAVRHKGFIPWDDDIDICMLRDDFERAIRVLPTECEKFGLRFYERDAVGELGIGYTRGGLWVDIFPVDAVKFNPYCPDEKTLKRKIMDYSEYFALSRKNASKDIITEKKVKIMKCLTDDNNADVYVDCMEYNGSKYLYPSGTLFPIRRIEFEGYMLNAPADTDTILKCMYGDYMRFPQEGVCHHIDAENLGDKELTKIKSELDEIYDQLK